MRDAEGRREKLAHRQTRVWSAQAVLAPLLPTAMLRHLIRRSMASPVESGNMAILLAKVFFSTAALLNPPALCAAPFAKGGSWVPSFAKGGTGRISPAVLHGSRTPN